MSNFTTYAERLTVLQPIVCGYKLNPLTIGHLILLKSANSKFVGSDYTGFTSIDDVYKALIIDKTLIGEFAYALLVCSTTFDEFKDECNSFQFNEAFDECKLTLLSLGIDIAKEIHKFAHYLKAGTKMPLYYVKEDKNSETVSSSTSSPITNEENIISTLMSECNYTRSECMNLPYTEIFSAFILYAHKRGVVEIMSENLYTMLEAANKGASHGQS
jgi:hypothetical protein